MAKRAQRFQFQVRMHEVEHAQIAAAAKEAGMPVGTWIRWIALQVAAGKMVAKRAA
jgi:predicted HicB family RNase H-like nuclease